MAAKLSTPKPQLDPWPKVLGPGAGEEEGEPRITLRIVTFRRRLLDDDNAQGGCKFLIDAIRRAGLIPDDNPGCIRLVTEQKKVKGKYNEGTLVLIEFP